MSKEDKAHKLNISDHSWNMKYIHSKNTKIEVVLRKALWNEGFRYRKNYKKLPGSPDIALTKYKIAIFCDGEFFHGKDWEQLKQRLEGGNNPDFWISKIERNQKRDIEVTQQLEYMGWTVLRFWGKEIKGNIEECIKAVKEIVFLKYLQEDE